MMIRRSGPLTNNYEYALGETGIILNEDNVLPFFDVTTVTGLDTPTVEPTIEEIDGGHGGIVTVRYVSTRTIVIEGELYDVPDNIEATVDEIAEEYFPSNDEVKFYFKYPGVAERYVLAKPLGFKSDTTTTRRIGQATCQIQLAVADPRKYIDNADVLETVDTPVIIANDGWAPSFPIFEIPGSVTVTSIVNGTTGQTLTFSPGIVVGVSDLLVIDTQRRTIKLDGVDASISKTAGSEWPVLAKGNNTITVNVSGSGSGVQATIKTKSAWM